MTEQKASYTLTIEADSGYESTTEGRCTAYQYGQAIAALHGKLPQRTWVGLTDDEMSFIKETTHPENRWTLMERVEAKLKEKNT